MKSYFSHRPRTGKRQAGIAAIGIASLMLLASGMLLGTTYLARRAGDPQAKLQAQQENLDSAGQLLNSFASVYGRLPCPARTQNGPEDCTTGAKGWLPVQTLEHFSSGSTAGRKPWLDVRYVAYRGTGGPTSSDPNMTGQFSSKREVPWPITPPTSSVSSEESFTPRLADGSPVGAGAYPVITSGLDLCGNLHIAPGEKVGLLGPVGSGKSTLLKLLSGMYMPSKGRVSLDGIDMQHISRTHLSDRLGYLPQDVRLFAGTLRDNLTSGIIGKTEQNLLAACELTGLRQVIAAHPKGLDMPIAEGGTGVSGGQKQLISLTRMVLAAPDVWLLDEPTASMDEPLEARTIAALRASVQVDQTLILVTHKPALLQLVDRLVILSPTGVVLDGPKAQVLQQLAARSRPAPATRPGAPLEAVA